MNVPARCACGHHKAHHWHYGRMEGCGHSDRGAGRCRCAGYGASAQWLSGVLAVTLLLGHANTAPVIIATTVGAPGYGVPLNDHVLKLNRQRLPPAIIADVERPSGPNNIVYVDEDRVIELSCGHHCTSLFR